MSGEADALWMARAIAHGARGLGAVWPNPAVGCLIVRDGRLVGRGRTAAGGRPHAEVRALEAAGGAARGAVAYVSLEPCAHHGQTPPCAEALIAAGIARVVVPAADPDPRVAGAGLERLRAAGVEVTRGVLAARAETVQKGFLTRVRLGRPMVTLKLAASLDGRIATASGESQWITGPGARRAVHGLRLSYDAVMVGGGTARADDPRLTVRGLGAVRQPVRIVVSRRLNLPRDGALHGSVVEAPLWLAHGADAAPGDVAHWTGAGAESVVTGVDRNGRVDPADLMARLGARGLTRVLCEGGGVFAAALLSAGLVDEVVGFTAGLTIGAEGRPALGAMGLERLGDAPHFTLAETAAIGGDVMHRWVRA